MFARRLLYALRSSSIKALTPPLPHMRGVCTKRHLCSTPSITSEELLSKLTEQRPTWRVTPLQENQTQQLEIISYLSSLRIPTKDMIRILSIDPLMLKQPVDVWQSRIAFLEEYGFKPLMAFKLLHNHRELWTGGEKKLYDTMGALRLLGFHDGQLQRYCTRCTPLFNLTPEQIHMPYNVLLKYFSQVKCLKILLNNLGIFSLSVDEIDEILMYIFKEMGIDDDDDIIGSSLFDHSLMHIKTRHTLLDRAGLFVRPNKKGATNIENPTLSMILDSSSAEFAEHLCGMTQIEVATFAELFAKEVDVHFIEEVFDEGEESNEEESDDDEDVGSSYHRKR